MPVITRSCGKSTRRRRIEDPTPRACRTTAKRRKEVSDEESERPPKKKPIIGDKKFNTPKTANKRSRIPLSCLTENNPVKTRSQISNNKDDDDDDDDEIQFKTTAEVKQTETEQTPNVPCTEPHAQTPLVSPVAARTRSYSALRRSYKRKKKNQDLHQANDMEISSTSTEGVAGKNAGEDCLQEREKEDEAPRQVKEADSSMCNDENDHHHNHQNSNEKEKNDHYYKDKFHEMVQKLKQMQEQFGEAHQNTLKNIKAYDTFIKELTTSLEHEKRKNATIEEELKETREQLLMTQKEIETAKTNEKQQNNNESVNSVNTCVSQESSQSEERSDISEEEGLDKAETSTLLAMIKFYSELTGITLSTDIPPSNSAFIESFHCAYRPKGPNSNVMKFRLTHDKEFNEYEYSPSFPTPKKGEFLHKLPGHLKENMFFESEEVQPFLSSLIQAVHKQK